MSHLTPGESLERPRTITTMDTSKKAIVTTATTHTAVLATALAGAKLSRPDSVYYKTLRKPSWMPSNKVFPLVWTPMFVDIGVVMARTLTEELKDDSELGERIALCDTAALGVNLALNVGWSAAFFRTKNRPLATAIAGALTVSSADLVRRVARRNTPGAVALSVYPAWCAFATALSGAITRLNK